MVKLIIILFLLNSCVTINNKKEFTYYKESNAPTLDLLNINGYYFCLDSFYKFYNYKSVGTRNYLKQKIEIWTKDSILAYGINTIILYKDGRTLVGYNSIWNGLEYKTDTVLGENTFAAAKASFQDYMKVKDNKNYKSRRSGIWDWGIYKFNSDTIKIQYFSNKTGNYDLIELQGVIKDKNNFRLVHWKNISSKKNISKVIDKLYMFQSCEFRPDSTNNYLDKLIQRIKSK